MRSAGDFSFAGLATSWSEPDETYGSSFESSVSCSATTALPAVGAGRPRERREWPNERARPLARRLAWSASLAKRRLRQKKWTREASVKGHPATAVVRPGLREASIAHHSRQSLILGSWSAHIFGRPTLHRSPSPPPRWSMGGSASPCGPYSRIFGPSPRLDRAPRWSVGASGKPSRAIFWFFGP